MGITSNRRGCAVKGFPGIYTRLAYYADWIESVLDGTHGNTQPPLTSTKPPSMTYKCDRAQVSCGCGQQNVDFTMAKVSGAQEAVPYSWPMMASVHLAGSKEHACAGTIIDESHILTTAHCVRGENAASPKDVSVSVGMHNRSDSRVTVHRVDRVHVHPQWSANTDRSSNDIAILHVSTPLNFSNDPSIYPTCVPPMKLPTPVTEYPPSGAQLAVTGWGVTQAAPLGLSDNLQQTMMDLIANDDPTCNEMIKDRERQFCAGLPEEGKGQFLPDREWHVDK